MGIKIGMKVLLIIVILVVIAIVAWSFSGYFVKDGNLSGLDEFAKCLSEKGVAMYGAEWCGHCKQQKEMFGSSFKYVNYVECPNSQAICEEKGITGYPTWIINGVNYPGTQSFEELSQLSGCPLSQ